VALRPEPLGCDYRMGASQYATKLSDNTTGVLDGTELVCGEGEG
jgi:hypothetical protein